MRGKKQKMQKKPSLYKITAILEKSVQVADMEDEKNIIEVPKYKLPLVLEVGQILQISKFGMYEDWENE